VGQKWPIFFIKEKLMYVDEAGAKHHHIHLIKEERDGLLPGWYYSDETEDMNGPFETFEETRLLLDRYVAWLCSGPGDNKE